MLDQTQFNAVAPFPSSFAQSSINSDQVADQQDTNILLQNWSQESGSQRDLPSNPEQHGGIPQNGFQSGFSNLEQNDIQGSDEYNFFT